jgi:hypothetical protein
MKAFGPKSVNVHVPWALCSTDCRNIADWLDDLADGNVPSTIGNADASAAHDVAAWLRDTAKFITDRDDSEWRSAREESSDRSFHQRIAGLYGVGEATVRKATPTSRLK